MNAMSLRRSKRMVVLGSAVVGLMALAGCAQGAGQAAEAGGSKDPYRVLYIAGLTGAAADSAGAVRGMELGIDRVNKNGGVNGHKVELVKVDDQSDATRAVTVLQEQLNSGKKPDLVIAGKTSNEALAMMPVLAREKIVTLSTASSPLLDDAAKYPQFFSVGARQDGVIRAAAEFLKRKGTVKKVALVISDDALGQGTETPFTKEMQAAGFETNVFRYNPKNVDLTGVFQQAKSFGADWIYADGTGEAPPNVLNSRVKAGADSIPTIGGAGIAASQLMKYSTPEMRANFYPALYPLTTYVEVGNRSPVLNEYLAALGDLESLPLTVNTYAYNWDMIQIWAAGVKQAGTADGPQVAKALEGLKVSQKDGGWLLWSKLYSNSTHFPQVTADDFTFAQITGKKETMYTVVK